MPIIEVDGVGRVEVDAAFDRLTPAQQQQTVNSIAAEARAGRPQGTASPARMGAMEDVARSAATGVAQGVVGSPGLPGDIATLTEHGADWLARQPGRAAGLSNEEMDRRLQSQREQSRARLGFSIPSPADVLPTGQSIQDWWGRNVAPWYRPQTTEGEYARTAGEFTGGAATIGGLAGATARNAPRIGERIGQFVDQTLRYGTVPGLVSEAGGQATKGTAAEPYVRAGAGLAAGVAGGLMQARRAAPGQIIEQNVGQIDPADVARAQALMDQARALPRPPGSPPMTLTFPEALASVTQGRQNLGPVMSTVEAMPGGRQLREAMAERPAATRGAFEEQLQTLRPQELAPGDTVARTARAATGEVDMTRDAINAATRPLYRAAENTQIPQPAFDTLRTMPGFDEALQAARTHRAIGPTIAHLPANSVGVLDAVKKQLGYMAETASTSGNPALQRQAAGIYGDARRATRAAAANYSPEYSQAIQGQRQMRQQVLEPLERSATGQLAEAASMDRIQSVIFNPTPIRGSEREVHRAVRAVATRDMVAAENAVGNSIARVFDEAMQNTSHGPNQFGGARFAAVIAGNDQQARNLRAALNAVDPGRANGFRRFLEVVDAQQFRQAPNSATAGRQNMMQQIAQGGPAGQIGRAILSPRKLAGVADDLFSQWRMRATASDLARIFTSRDVAQDLRQLARIRANTPRAVTIAAQIIDDGIKGWTTTPSQPQIGNERRQ